METAAPTKFGKYDVVGVLGKGAMGIVYDCRDPVIGRRVAIKTVLKESLDSSEAEGLLGRFKQEAQAAGRLNHPGVVSIYDYGETADVAFIAMEYISGKELKSYFDKGEKFALTDTVRIMSAILEALEHAHQSKVVHRDIKPANIMITDDARVKVADFGVAKIESSLATQIGTRVGTPAYMAPEQHRMMAVDGRADLFSCGVILYQFLTHGARPFTGGSQTIARNILTQTPTPPSQINVELLPVWDALVKKALAKRADERFQTARDFVDALRRAMGDVPAAPAGQSSGAEDATKGGSRPAAEQAAPGGTATNTNSGRPERTDLAMESELEFWKEIKDSDHPDDFAAFIDSFPDGRFSHLAKRRLDKLNRAAAGARAPNDEDQTELSAGHTVAKPVPGSTTQSGAGPLENKAPVPPDGGAEREAGERARQEAEQQAQRETEARQREAAAARQHDEAEQQARRAAAELAEREARARAQQEAEERKQQALQREAARIASEKELLQQQEQAKREAEAKRERELESHKRKEAEEKEKALKAAQERKAAEEQRQREALEKREAEAKAKRDALEQERQKKEADAKAAKEAQAAKELAERNRREAEKAARETEERTRKEAQAKRASEELAKAKAEAARVEREAAEKARRGAAAQAEADATVIRQVNVGAPAVRPAKKDAAVPAQFDPDATAIRHVDAYAAPARPGAAAGGDAAVKKASTAADIDVDIDLTENAPAYHLKDAGTRQTAPSPSPAPVALKSSGPLAATPTATPGAGADAIRVPQPAAIGVAGGRPAVSATMRTAQDEDDAPNLPEARKKPVFMIAGAAVALVAAGIGWFQFTSNPQPSIPSPGQAGGIEGKPAKDQANTEAQRQPKDAASKAVPDGVAGKSAPPSPVTPGASATAEAQKAREAAEERKAEQEAQNRAAEKAAADKVTAEKLAAAKSGAEKAAITKAAADKAAADKLALEKLAAAKSAADKAAADKLAADKAAADKVAADKAAADKLALDKAAADKAAADKLAADKAAADRVASAGGSIADRIAAASAPPELYKRAVALRSEGKASQAVPLLRQASSQGHGPSSRLLAVIFKDGAPDVRADFRQAERFQALAESQGER